MRGEKKLLKGLKTKYFRFIMKFERQEEEREEEEIKNIRDENGLIDYGKLIRKVGVKERKMKQGIC